MHFDALTAPEQRVLGCLIEKRFTTPDQYPLSVHALRSAANQSTNRDPVVAYDEDTVFQAAQRLCQYGLARLASGHSSRATKFRHLAEEGLGVDRGALAVLCVLLLRGPQTPGELKLRTERMVALGSLEDVERVLGDLEARGYARRLHRRPGQKEDRFGQLLGGAVELDDGPVPASARAPYSVSSGFSVPARRAADAAAADSSDPDLAARVSALEAEVASLSDRLSELLG